MRHKCIPIEAPGPWNDALCGIPHAFAHTWESCYAMRLTTGYPTYLYCFENASVRIVCPIAERRSDEGIDIVTPYGFSGFAGTADCTDFPRYWREFVRERGYIAGYISLNPALENRSYYDREES